jgi:hypothetical protein
MSDDTLQAENARLRCEVAELRARLPEPVSRAPYLPTPSELDQLLELIVGQYPMLKARSGLEHELRCQFERAFAFLAFCRRSDRLATNRSLAFWVDDAADWLRRRGHHNTEVGAAAFTAAAIAWGIRHTPINDTTGSNRGYPYVVFGLAGGDSERAHDPLPWKTLLETRKLPESAALPALTHERRTFGQELDVMFRRGGDGFAP